LQQASGKFELDDAPQVLERVEIRTLSRLVLYIKRDKTIP
jgi:hypothetical protein